MKTLRQGVLDAVDGDIEKYFLVQKKTSEGAIIKIRHHIFSILIKQGFSQNEMAEFFGVSQPSINYGLRKYKKSKKSKIKRIQLVNSIPKHQKLCRKCSAITEYKLGEIPICLTCINEIENSSSYQAIIKKAELITGVSYELMKKRTRKPNVVEAKYLAMKLLYKPNVRSLAFVGDLFGNDHATVVHGIKTITNLIETNQINYNF